MLELLYAINVAVFKAFGLPGLCAISTAIEWRMARWMSSSCMADEMGCVKTLATALKNAQPVPGAYIDEIPLRRIPPRLHSSSVHKMSLPAPRMSIMPCVEICASPIEDDGGAFPAQRSFEDLRNGDVAGYLSDDDVRFPGRF